MATVTHEMVTWLGGVLDRIEQKATAADPPPSAEDAEFGDTRSVWTDPHGEFRSRGGPVFEHVLTHSPANVLPLVAAARAIIAEHEIQWPEADFRYCRVCQDREAHDAALAPCRTLRLLAAGFSHWPGYRPEWGPQ